MMKIRPREEKTLITKPLMCAFSLAALALVSFLVPAVLKSRSTALRPSLSVEGSRLHDLQYYQQTIFVRVELTGPSGASVDTDFIIDTGSVESTVDISLVTSLALKAQPSGVRNITSIGSTFRLTYLLPHINALSQQKDNLEVIVDDLSVYSKGYGRQIGGLLGMDFLKNYVLLLDFHRRQLQLARGIDEIKIPNGLVAIALQFDRDLPIVNVTLANNRIVRLVFDTGCDTPSDATFFQSEVRDMRFHPSGKTDKSVDGAGSVTLVHGTVPLLAIGDIRIPFALVSIEQTSEIGILPYAGLLGLHAFDSGIIVVDFSAGRLLVTQPIR